MRDNIAPAIEMELRRLVQTLRAMDSGEGLPPGSDRPWYVPVRADEVDLLLAKIDGARTSGGVASPINWAPDSARASVSRPSSRPGAGGVPVHHVADNADYVHLWAQPRPFPVRRGPAYAEPPTAGRVITTSGAR
jgi:hypothetical protein